MKIKYMSDLHLEFQGKDTPFNIIPSSDDGDTILVLAGDIGVFVNPDTYVPFITEWAGMFKAVIYVPGNHEYYHGCITDAANVVKEIFNTNFNNVFLLDNDEVTIDGINFIGSTLWTDFGNNDPVSKMLAKKYMTDYSFVSYQDARNGWHKINPDFIHGIHQCGVEFLQNKLRVNQGNGQKTVVVTHHLPSFQSVHNMYAGEKSNDFFASNLEHLIYNYNPLVWIHGHTHHGFDYMIGDTRVLCNPRGYPGYDRNKFFNCDKHVVL